MCSIWASETRRFASMAALAAALLLCCVAVPAQAGCSKRVVLYNASWCPYCKQVRAILARNHIQYSILDATTARVQADMVRRFGDTAVPRTLVGGVLVEGVDEARIKQLCRQGQDLRGRSLIRLDMAREDGARRR